MPFVCLQAGWWHPFCRGIMRIKWESFHQPLGTSLELLAESRLCSSELPVEPLCPPPRLLREDRILLLSPSLGYIWSSCQQAIWRIPAAHHWALKHLAGVGHKVSLKTSCQEPWNLEWETWEEHTHLSHSEEPSLCVSVSLCICLFLNLLMTVPGWTQETPAESSCLGKSCTWSFFRHSEFQRGLFRNFLLVLL